MTGSSFIDLWCKDAVELVTDYLEHGLSAEDRVRFEKHLLTCPPCTEYLAQMRTTIELAAELAREPTNEPTTSAPDAKPSHAGLEQQLLAAFRRRQRGGPAR
jgi:anti-sigma factor RsiW